MKNKHKYNSFRIWQFGGGILLGFVFLLLPRRKNRIIFNSTLNNFYNFNSKYLFEYFLKDPTWECRFVINDESKRAQLISEIGPYFISSKGLRAKIYCLRAMVWITSSLETPVGGVFLSVRRLVYHLGHGSPFKRAGLSEKTASFYKKIYLHLVQTNFSYFLASSPRMVEFICSNFGCSKRKVIVQSQPRLQSLLDRLHETKTKNAHKFSILYAPTWRGANNTALFPLSDYDWNALNKFLKDHNVTIWLRLHPEFENSDHIQQFLSEQIRPLDSHAVPEIMDALDRFDLLITDYSSIYVDFLVLNRPVFFFPYDLKEYENTIGLIGPYEELTGGPLIFEFRDFLNQLANILNGKDDFREKRQILNRFFNGNLKAPCRENYRFVIDYLKRRA